MPNYSGKPSDDDLMRSVKRQTIEGMKRLDKDKKKPQEAADEMWLNGGPESTFEGRKGMFSKAGGYALASRDGVDALLSQRQKNRRKKSQGGGEYA